MATYLTRGISAGNQKTFTISVWCKKAETASDFYGTILSYADTVGGGGSTPRGELLFYEDRLQFGFNPTASSWSNYYPTSGKLFRDVNAWYHIVVAVDTTQGTASNRLKMYVNGELLALNSTIGTQNMDTGFNKNSSTNHIGRATSGTGNFYKGLMSHFHFVDGAQLAPTVFGSTDSTTGEWKINTSPSYTVGTNGFFILKDGMGITDQSANSNNWTVGGGTITKTEDNPSNVFATLNPLNQTNSGAVFSHGNTKMSISGQWLGINSTLFMGSGKYYWEIKYGSGNYDIGIAQLETAATQISEISTSNHGYIGRKTGGYALAQNGGQPYKVNANSNDGNYGSQASSGNILMVAYDADNGKLFTGINGAWNNSSNPATGASPMYTVTSTEFYCPSVSVESGSLEINFGNGYFGQTAVSSAGTNASGNGIFEYNVPAGYTALSTKGLNL